VEKALEQIMNKSLNEVKRQVDRRGDEETLKHLSLLNELKQELGGDLITLDFAYIPDRQAEGFRLLVTTGVESFKRVVKVLTDEDYFTFDGNTSDEFGCFLDKDKQLTRLRHNGVLLPDSFIRSVRYNDCTIIDIALYKKELPCV
jgi:hypothetical protein